MARRLVRNVLLCDAMTLLRSFRLQYENNKQPYEEKRKRTCRSCQKYRYLRIKTVFAERLVLRRSSLFKNYTGQIAVLTGKKSRIFVSKRRKLANQSIQLAPSS